MDRSNNGPLPLDSPGDGTPPVVLISQLMQSATRMQHVDEVFFWVANAIAQHLEIPIVQFWAAQTYTTGQVRAEVRVSVSQYPSIAQQSYTNRQVTAVVERLLKEQRGLLPYPLASLLPSPQAQALAHYNLYSWAGYYLKYAALLPPQWGTSTAERVATPLSMLISLFTPQPLVQQRLRDISFLLEQAVRVAVSHGLLTTSAPASQPRIANERAPQSWSLRLFELIPRRTQNLEELQASSPFASALIITDKRARRLYSAIDGHKNLTELVEVTRLEQQDLIEALRYLLHSGQIRLYESGGKAVEHTAFLPPLT